MWNKEERITTLIQVYGNTIFRLCYLYLKDYHLAEDATQETFIKVYKGLDGFRNESSEKTWITKIAVNECKNCMRKNWFKKERNPFIPNMNESYCQFEDDASITAKIKELPLKYKEVILLYYYQEMNVKEISRILCVSESAVQQRLKRGRKMLKDNLKENGYE